MFGDKNFRRRNMQIHGLNKLTLLDYPGLTACTVFTGGCNFRCPFCHNRSLVLDPSSQPVIPEEEFFAYLKKRVGIIEGVCVTGGEPTLNKDLKEFIINIKRYPYKVKLDTNGTRPDVIKELAEEGLIDYVAMDIKNSREKYGLSIGIENYDTSKIEESVNYLLQGKIDYEFRTTVVREFNDKKSFADIAEWLSGAEKYFLQAFKDSGDLIDNTLSGYSRAEMDELLPILREKIGKVEIRGID